MTKLLVWATPMRPRRRDVVVGLMTAGTVLLVAAGLLVGAGLALVGVI